MNGLAPLTPTTVLHHAELFGVSIEPWEADALYTLDGILRTNGAEDDA